MPISNHPSFPFDSFDEFDGADNPPPMTGSHLPDRMEFAGPYDPRPVVTTPYEERSKSAQFTSQYCGSYTNISEQFEGESDMDFRDRVVGELRKQARVIEAHECLQGARYDSEGAEGENVMKGLIGAAAMALQGKKYPNPPGRDDTTVHEYMAGEIVEHDRKNPPMSPEQVDLMMMMFGGSR